MALFDLPLDQLRAYRAPADEPGDFDAFWAQTLAETRGSDLAATFTPVDVGLDLVRVADVTFAGWGGHPIRGWFITPTANGGPLPCVVQFQGYGGGRGLPHQHLIWAAAGFAHFVMDTRGQGSGYLSGDTPDPVGSTPSHPGFMTRGVLDPREYYYRRVFSDAVRAVEAARSHPAVDPTRVAVAGGSQGGGISLAVSGLVEGLAGVAADVPFLCHYRRGAEITDVDPYGEIARYLRVHRGRDEVVFRTLSYFDGVAFARRATAPALISVGLMDTTCPPSTVYAAFNAYAGEKEMREYAFNDHEGGGPFHSAAVLAWLRQRFKA